MNEPGSNGDNCGISEDEFGRCFEVGMADRRLNRPLNNRRYKHKIRQMAYKDGWYSIHVEKENKKACFDLCPIIKCPQHGYDEQAPSFCLADPIIDRFERRKRTKTPCNRCEHRKDILRCKRCIHQKK